MRALIAILVITSLLFSIALPFPLIASPQDWGVVSSTLTNRVGGKVYPGSASASLIVELRYLGVLNATAPYGCISLPEVVELVSAQCAPARNADGDLVSRVAPGEVVRFSYIVNVKASAAPGTYEYTINISYYVGGELRYELARGTFNISPYPPLALEVLEVAIIPYSYPGAYPVSLNMRVANRGESTITYMKISYEFPRDVIIPYSGETSYTGAISPQSASLISIPNLMISPGTGPATHYGIIRVNATLQTDDGISYADVAELSVAFTIEEPPAVRVAVLDYGLTSNFPRPGLHNTALRILIRMEDRGTLRLTHARISLTNARFSNGSSIAVAPLDVVLNTYDIATITFPNIDINEGAQFLLAHIVLYGARASDGSTYSVNISYTLIVPLDDSLPKLDVVRVMWQGSPAVPGSAGNTLIIAIANNYDITIRDAEAELILPQAFRPSAIMQSNIQLGARSLQELVFSNIVVAINASPGLYEAQLHIRGFGTASDGSTFSFSTKLLIQIEIASVDAVGGFKPKLEAISYYWGELAPAYVYVGNSRAPLTIIFRNYAVHEVGNVVIELRPLNKDVSVLNPNATCSQVVPPGGTCSVIFYVDLSRASPGPKIFEVIASYTMPTIGIHNIYTSAQNITLVVPDYPPGGGVIVVHSGWANNYDVYEGMSSAVYTITLVSLEPYPISSIWVRPELPACISITKGSQAEVYVPGPVPSLQAFSVNFQLNVTCGKGDYAGIVIIDYYLQTGGGGVRKSSASPISFVVKSPEGAIEVIAYGWLGNAPTHPAKYAQYFVILRNSGFQAISNPVLRVELPPGLANAKNGERTINVTPTSVIPSTAQLPAAGLTGIAQLDQSSLQELLKYLYGAQAPVSPTVNKGDYMTFVLEVEITEELSRPPAVANATLSFIDHWNELYSIELSVPFAGLFRPPLLTVSPLSTSIRFVNGTASLGLVLKNEYPYDVYNVYMALSPITNNAIPLGNVRYIPRLRGNSTEFLTFELVYNPIPATMGAVSITQPSAAFLATLIYRDASGAINIINSTVAVIVEPLIKVEVVNLAARYQKGALVVTGILLNTGLSSARNALIVVEYNGAASSSLVGDIDGGSQVPFRVELQGVQFADMDALIIVRYIDEYNNQYVYTYTVKPVIATAEATAPQPQQAGLEPHYLAIIAIVGAFLASVFYLIHKHLKRMRLEVAERP